MFSAHILCAELLHVMQMQRSFGTKLSYLENLLISNINPVSKVYMNIYFLLFIYSSIYYFIYLYF